MNIEESLLRSIIRKSLKRSSKKPLVFLGFGTTGGVDSNLSQYWVDNLFQFNSSSYCSNLPPGFTCVGVLRKTQKLGLTYTQEKYRKMAAKIVRKNPILSKITSIKRSKDPLLPLEEAIFITAWTENQELITAFEFDYAQETFRKIYDVLRETQVRVERLTRVNENSVFREVDHELTRQFPIYSCLKGFFISRKGEYSCPGRTFFVLCSEEYIQCSKENFQLFEGIKTLDDLKVLCDHEANLKIESISETENYQVCHFKRTSGSLKPLFWFKFSKETDTQAELALKQFSVSKYIYVSFCDIDNKMTEMHDQNNNPNLDFTYIVPYGFEFSNA